MGPIEHTPPRTAPEYAALLGERQVALLQAVLTTLGAERCEAILATVLALEADGGMPRLDGQGRRTPGGAFLALARERGTGKERYRLFGLGQPPAPRQPRTIPPIDWPSAVQAMVALPLTAYGKGIMKTTFIGTPGKVEARGDCLLFTVKVSDPASGLPTGLPQLDPSHTTIWVVFVAAKQWRKIAPVLAEHPDDKVICEGVPVLRDGQPMLFTTSMKSVFQERARREAQQAAAGAL